MNRRIERYLRKWKNSSSRKPLLLRGARQIGKSYTIAKFGKEEFENLLVVNFELHPETKTFFQSRHPDEILKSLELFYNTKITHGKTLLFLDEIQECPDSIQALRYF